MGDIIFKAYSETCKSPAVKKVCSVPISFLSGFNFSVQVEIGWDHQSRITLNEA
jgi:hypothetical protein